VVNDAISRLLFSMTNVAFANGTEPASSTLTGPGLAGLMLMTPSIPDSPPDEVCPAAVQIAMTTSPKTMNNVRNLTGQYIHAAWQWPTVLKTTEILMRLALDEAIVASKILRSSYK
jgi:hypothetical protein